MTQEFGFVEALRAIVVHPGARGLLDDVAVLPPPVGRQLVLTHDMIVEGVHYLPTDPPGDVAWKLVAVNLSDLAAKGAGPMGLLMGFTLGADADWNAAFVEGLGRAIAHFDVPLLGGDTVSTPGPRVLGLTAIGEAASPVPDRRGAQPHDMLWVSGTIGDAGQGLRIAKAEVEGPRRLLKRYRLPMPRLKEGQALRPLVHAMSDVSDGLLIDARRMASASNLVVRIDLDAVPLSPEYSELAGSDRAARLQAVTAGDDYELLFAAPASAEIAIRALGIAVCPIGRFETGEGLSLHDRDGEVPLPAVLGFLHSA